MFDGWRGRSEPLVVSERQVGAYRTENPVALQSIEPGVAVVTGGARGIGFAIARMLGSEGASVIVVDKDGDETPSALEQLRAAGVAARAEVVDLADLAAAESVSERLFDRESTSGTGSTTPARATSRIRVTALSWRESTAPWC